MNIVLIMVCLTLFVALVNLGFGIARTFIALEGHKDSRAYARWKKKVKKEELEMLNAYHRWKRSLEGKNYKKKAKRRRKYRR